MNRLRAAATAAASLTLLALSSPQERMPTDPKSVASLARPEAGSVPIDDLYYTRALGGAAWSPDGQEIVLTTNLTGRFNLWTVRASGSWPVQLSQSDDRQSSAVWSRDGKWIVYQQDSGGGEIYDLFAIPSSGGASQLLTQTADVSETFPRFSPDGQTLAIEWKPKTASATDLALLDWKTRTVKRLTSEKTKDHSWAAVAWSPDGKSLYAVRTNVAFTDSDVYKIDVGSGSAENLTPHKGQIRHAAQDLSADGRTILLTSNEKEGIANVALLDVTSRKLTWVTHERWECAAREFSPDGKALTYTVNEDGRTGAYLYDRDKGQAEKLALGPGQDSFSGNPSAFSPSGDRLLLVHQSSQEPADLWIYDRARRQATKLTRSAVASLSTENLPPSQLIHYKSFDGRIISAFLWVPFNLKRDGSNPGIVVPHGGPTGQTADTFNRTVAALASRGYTCIAPNVRGSTGYGLEFQKANYQDLGGGDLQDEVAAAKFLAATGYVDAKKIGITGGSYGGYMALMAIGKTPEVWAAAVELYGILDWYTMLEHEDPFLQEYEKSLLGDPVKDRKVYEDASPVKYIRNAKAPLLVLQGANDIRVPKEEADQVVEILKKEGRTVEAHYYPNEGHGFVKRENQIDSIRRTVEWFDRYLKKPS